MSNTRSNQRDGFCSNISTTMRTTSRRRLVQQHLLMLAVVGSAAFGFNFSVAAAAWISHHTDSPSSSTTLSFLVGSRRNNHGENPTCSTSTTLFVRQRKQARAKAAVRPLHHPNRLKDPLSVEHSLLSQPMTHENGDKKNKSQKNANNNNNKYYQYILGSDESGVGAIAGPIVAATVCLTQREDILDKSQLPTWLIEGVQDCKRLTREEKRRIYQELLQSRNDHDCPYRWTVAIRTASQIDDEYPTVQHATLDALTESTQDMVRQLQQQQEQENNEPVSVYSIVDGKSYPKQPKPSPTASFDSHNNDGDEKNHPIPGRPWPQGDTVVYTVALASIIAQVVRDQIMEEQAAAEYPQFDFHIHKGYGGHALHKAALQRFGRTPWHRNSCGYDYKTEHGSHGAEENDDNHNGDNVSPTTAHQDAAVGMDRRATILTLLTAVTTSTITGMKQPPPANAMYMDSKTGIRLPEPGEIASAVPSDWTGMDNPLILDDSSSSMTTSSSSPRLSRLDSSNDAIFYQDPRFVEHVDEQAVQLMTQYIGTQVLPDTTRVLDLCSSWTSHFPSSTTSNNNKLTRVAGLGMNAQELKANPSLTEWVVQDLNAIPFQRLPYEDGAFDAILCQLSIDYLTQPLEVCREMGRVLRSGGTAHILFSNRLFLSKAVALWTGADDIDHTYTVASYFYFCNNKQQPPLFTKIQAKDLSVRNKSGKIIGDPLYVVTATRA